MNSTDGSILFFVLVIAMLRYFTAEGKGILYLEPFIQFTLIYI